LLRATKRRGIATIYAALNGKAGSTHTHTHKAETEAYEAAGAQAVATTAAVEHDYDATLPDATISRFGIIYSREQKGVLG
jgi:hypothetical protein